MLGTVQGVADEVEWLNRDELTAWKSFMLLQLNLTAHLDRELNRLTGLSGADYHVLVGLSGEPTRRLRLGELGERLNWSKSRLSHQIRRMGERGLVTRVPSDTDPRAAYAVLTDAGLRTIEDAAPVHVRLVREFFVDPLNKKQLSAFTQISRVLLKHLDERLCDILDDE